MEFMILAYMLIAGVLGAYTISLRGRLDSAQRERQQLQSKDE